MIWRSVVSGASETYVGSVTVNVQPFPTTLATAISPPIKPQNFWLMAMGSMSVSSLKISATAPETGEETPVERSAAVDPLRDWAEGNLKEVLAAQRRYDAQHQSIAARATNSFEPEIAAWARVLPADARDIAGVIASDLGDLRSRMEASPPFLTELA